MWQHEETALLLNPQLTQTKETMNRTPARAVLAGTALAFGLLMPAVASAATTKSPDSAAGIYQAADQQIAWSQSIGFHKGKYPVSDLATTLILPAKGCTLQTGDYQQLLIISSNGTAGFAIGWYYTGTAIEEYTWTVSGGGAFYGQLSEGSTLNVSIVLNETTGEVAGEFNGVFHSGEANVGTQGIVGQEDVGEYPGDAPPPWVEVGFIDLNYNNGVQLNPDEVDIYYGPPTYSCDYNYTNKSR
jgi:hypothetical protein